MSIEVLNESGIALDERALVEVARHALDAMGVSPLAELAISLKDVAEMERLHRHYMDLPGPTDVLAFAQDDLDLGGSRGAGNIQGGQNTDSITPPTLLGDVVLCPLIAERQAAEAGHSMADELALLTTHGVLHLLGYDHAEPDEHAEMFALQGELLRSYRHNRGQGHHNRGQGRTATP